jgi:DNA-binding CsgD family transcriptional regulator/tetratricopeptide (TPR) repeat protein
MALLEREDALASLAEYARSAKTGQGRLVLVSGEAGVGKTALLEAFREATPELTWLAGGCDGLFTPRPLAPLFDIAEQTGGALRTACDESEPRERLFALLLRELRESSAATVLVVEDAHWADEATLDLIRFLSRRIRDLAVLLVVTYRDDGLAPDHPLRIVLGEASSLRATRRLSVAPLTPQAVATIASGSGVLPAELFRLTGGNPFFVTEIVQSCGADVPPSASDAVLARMARLDESARRVVQCAALIGGRIEPWLLDEVSEQPPAAVDDAVSSGLLVADGGLLRFRHELARLAVADDIAPHRRQPVHAAVLAALQHNACEDTARLAYHAEGAGDGEAVLLFAPSAARQASALGSHREAVVQYERALRFADDEELRTLAGLHEGLSRELAYLDQWANATEEGERALELWRSVGDRRREADVMCHLARAMWRLNRGPDGFGYAEQAVAVLEPVGPCPELARAHSAHAALLMQNGTYSECLVAADQAIQLAEQLDLPDVLSDALNTQACMRANVGQDWEPMLRRALRVGAESGASDQVGRAYANLAALLITERRVADLDVAYADGLVYCEEHDIATYGYCISAAYAEGLMYQGRWDEAVDIAKPLLLSGLTSPANRIGLAMTLGVIAARRREPEAEALLAEVATSVAATAESDWICEMYPHVAEAAWLADDLERARELMSEVASRAHTADPWHLGKIVTWCRRLGLPEPDSDGLAGTPYALELAGDHVAAAHAWDRLVSPWEGALALYDAQTEESLREALCRFDALGAVAAVQVTRQAMRRLGVRSIPAGSRQATRAHPAGLTPRESEVLDLLCAGHTNGEISERLFIAAKTVDHHVSAVLAKLGVPSRAEAAAEAARRGLVGAQRR